MERGSAPRLSRHQGRIPRKPTDARGAPAHSRGRRDRGRGTRRRESAGDDGERCRRIRRRGRPVRGVHGGDKRRGQSRTRAQTPGIHEAHPLPPRRRRRRRPDHVLRRGQTTGTDIRRGHPGIGGGRRGTVRRSPDRRLGRRGRGRLRRRRRRRRRSGRRGSTRRTARRVRAAPAHRSRVDRIRRFQR